MKKFLLSLLLFVGSIISFGSCENIVFSGSYNYIYGVDTISNRNVLFGVGLFNYDRMISNGGVTVTCTFSNVVGLPGLEVLPAYISQGGNYTSSSSQITNFSDPYVYNFNSSAFALSFRYTTSIPFTTDVSFDWSCVASGNGIVYPDFGISCDVMTSNECQSNYNLMPISDVDQEYCLGNDLCPEIDNGSGDCENESGDVQWSALYINNIQHLGKPLINVSIPDYIFWDYSTDDEEFNLYVGSGYDQEYIDNVISINSYRPDSQDFTDVFVGGLSLVMPYIVIVLFIVFVRKFIKRIFK